MAALPLDSYVRAALPYQPMATRIVIDTDAESHARIASEARKLSMTLADYIRDMLKIPVRGVKPNGAKKKKRRAA